MCILCATPALAQKEVKEKKDSFLKEFYNDFLKYGTTDPLDAKTFPYLTTENFGPFAPDKLFAATNNLSEASLVAP